MAQLNGYQPLCLKHRPQSLTDLVGQQSVTRTLTNAIDHHRLTHAYLFTGPRGTGKTSSARILAKSLNCHAFETPTAQPCDKCTSCLEIIRGTSPAVFEIDAASNNSVDDARTLIERAPLVAAGSRFKIYIIDECHMLTKEAFNALLKTIEDPPPQVVFILATTEEHKVLPTIVSRCQRLMFRLARMEDLSAHLRKVAKEESIEIDEEAIQFIARRSGGGLRDALGLLDQASLLSQPGKPVSVQELLGLLGALHEDVLLSISFAIRERDGNQLLAAIASLLDEGREPAVIAQELSRHFLNLIKASYLADPKAVTSDVVLGSAPYIAGIVEQAPQFERAELAIILQSLDHLEQTCRRTSQPAMHLEIGMIAICHRRDFTIIGELEQRLQRLESGAPAAGQRMGAPVTEAPKPAPRPAPVPAPTAPAAAAPAPSAAPPATGSAVPRTAAAATASGDVTAAGSDAAEPVSQSPKPPVTPAENSASAVAEADLGEPPDFDFDDREPEGSTYMKSVAVIPAEPLPSQAVPTPVAASAKVADTESSGTSSGAESSEEDLEYIWSALLTELQKRNIPTFSVASTHGFPLSITQQVLEIGTTKEVFQKSLEQRTQHLQASAQTVCGRPIGVKVRLCNPEIAPGTPKASPRQSSSARSGSASSTPQADDSDEIGEQAGQQSSVSVMESPAVSPNRHSMPPTDDLPDLHLDTNVRTERADISDGIIARASSTQDAADDIQNGDADPVQHDSTTIKEAYKLFEGPGSRLVQKPKN